LKNYKTSPTRNSSRLPAKRSDKMVARYADEEVDLRRKNDSRTQQVLMVGTNKKVLEIGPASGYVTRALRRRGCDVTCVENDAKAARAARKYASRMIFGDIETLNLGKRLRQERYDVIVLGDVLEHLKDPASVLKRLGPYLRRSGYVVATVPNIAHGSVRLLLLDGIFDPQPNGILDFTHLHFYTRKTLQELFRDSGYAVRVLKEIRAPISEALNLRLELGEYPQELLRALESDPNSTVHQFAVIAKPAGARSTIQRIAKQRKLVSRGLRKDTVPELRSDPLSTVLNLYSKRRDLQMAFPEVRSGEYSQLLEWARGAVEKRADGYHILSPHASWYRDNHLRTLRQMENELQLKDNHIGNLEGKINALGDLLQPEQKDQLPLRDNHTADLDSKVMAIESQLRLNGSNITELENKVRTLDEQLQLKEHRLAELESELSSITSSFGYGVMRFYASRIDGIFPDGTRRGQARRLVQTGLRVLMKEGLSAFMRQAYEKTRMRKTLTVQLDTEPIPEPIPEKQFWEMSHDEQYQAWLRNNELTTQQLAEMKRRAAELRYRPKVSLIMPVYNTSEALITAAIDSVSFQAYPNWELCIADDASNLKHVRPILEQSSAREARIKVRYLSKNLGISGASNQALELATGDFVGFIDHDDELSKDALFAVVSLLNENPNLDLIYSDEDKLDQSGQKVEPFFKPDWSPDLLLSMNYMPHFLVIRKSLVDQVGGFRVGFEGSQDYDLVLRITELTDKIGHISRPLYSWRKVHGSAADSTSAKPYARESAKKALSEALIRRGRRGEVLDAGIQYRVKYGIEGNPLISIIIPIRDRVELLKRCLESIELRTSYKNYEIIIVDNGSEDQSTLSYLQSTRHKVVRFNEPFNFSRINNFGAEYAKGGHLLFLNNDTEIVEEHWLEAMLEHSQRKEVGMVGALLLYPSVGPFQGIQHAGVNIGVGGVAGHAFKYLQVEHSNYFDLHRVVRNCTAVTCACAMIKQELFSEVGGFDERFGVVFGDIDLCLRLRERGYSVIYTPYATLIHHESASRAALHPLEDEKYMIARWEHEFVKGDPFYNRNLTLLREDYALTPYGSYERPISFLLDLYNARPDLQAAFPEVREGKHFRLVKWAAPSGVTIDDVNPPLRAYFPYFQRYVTRHESQLVTAGQPL